MLSDEEEHDSVEALAHHLAVKCISCLTSYVRDKNPLSAKKFSSVIWLRANGDIELVRETNYLKQMHEELVTDSLFIEAFFSRNDASPFCSFYEGWVPDRKGEYIGDMKGRQHCIASALRAVLAKHIAFSREGGLLHSVTEATEVPCREPQRWNR
ncbi:MAG: hypothetical protein KBF26_01335 [Opitutaceae bacterium]|nr:hypothetical protein [Opitutaceae bacterium]